MTKYVKYDVQTKPRLLKQPRSSGVSEALDSVVLLQQLFLRYVEEQREPEHLEG